jgi:hypothetical protein
MSIFRGHILESRCERPEAVGRFYAIRGVRGLGIDFGAPFVWAGKQLVNAPGNIQKGAGWLMDRFPGGQPPPEAPYESTRTSRAVLAPLPAQATAASAFARAKCQGMAGAAFDVCMNARIAQYNRAVAQCKTSTGIAHGNCMNALLR